MTAEDKDKVVDIYKTLGNCNFENVGADITKLELFALVIITNNYPLIMRDIANKDRAKRAVWKLVSKWFVNGCYKNRRLKLSREIVLALTPLDVLELKKT